MSSGYNEAKASMQIKLGLNFGVMEFVYFSAAQTPKNRTTFWLCQPESNLICALLAMKQT